MKLLNTTELLDLLFTKQSRPSMRTWMRRVSEGQIPCRRIGGQGRLYYVLEEVQEAIANHQTTNSMNLKHEDS